MNSPMIQLLILVGIAVFLIIRLRNVLGTREGFEKPPTPQAPPENAGPSQLEVIEGGPDPDITDHVDEESNMAQAFAEIKKIEPSFGVSDFISGARGAYEMIVMGYEQGDLAQIQPFLSEEIYESFVDGVAAREDEGLSIDATFIGIRDVKLVDAVFDPQSREAEIILKFTSEMTSIVRNKDGEILEGSETEVKRQKSTWAFARTIGAEDPNWILVSTDG